VGFKRETKRVLRAERGEEDRIRGNWAVDAKKLAVRDRKKRNVVGVHLSGAETEGRRGV